MSASRPFSFAIVGAGRVATGIGVLLRRAGHRPVAVASRSHASALRAADLLGAPIRNLSDTSALGADVVIVGALDAAIRPLTARIAEQLPADAVVCHLAGSLGLEPLADWIDTGGDAAALHPVQACPTVEAAVERLPGSAWGVTCTPGAIERATDMIRLDLRGSPVEVAGDVRPVWHAASVITSNGISALLAAGESMLHAIGIADPQSVLVPLAAGSIANAQAGGGGAQTLTGPLVRGELETVERHLLALAALPDALEAYRAAARLILNVNSERMDRGLFDRASDLLERT